MESLSVGMGFIALNAAPRRKVRKKAPAAHFAKHRQNRSGFAKHWQIHPLRAENILPNIGKFQAILPNIGKTIRGRGSGRR
ncbi:MAG: hypothetical protein IJS32_07165 [Kiritimatiellae bacterium]|nr:hypothetical protein [Kiritimatiellia bacterium]